MSEFWESAFQDKQTMWGLAPAEAAVAVADFFWEQDLEHILIPGFGYGRNARPFVDRGMTVTGIEISETAIRLAEDHFGGNVRVHHGPVGNLPFDREVYDGVFCYALLHLLDQEERKKLIADCYRQLRPGGYMVFVTLSTDDAAYGKGASLGQHYFRAPHGVNLYFHDEESMVDAFIDYGLIEAEEINDPADLREDQPSRRFWRVVCQKVDSAL
ncbi:class I SAM-dependent methyltransferase [Lewinella sp. IMCC34191]|uniref:class I SAM-dependent methyltransferase n=1 Tax=Lewinella sp. IMCC34191 TaxID=2259172 RepID=UPI000E26ADB0|nr:class I SAM-dependent methyltransferase [Lewinella sp. IMCC34191]